MTDYAIADLHLGHQRLIDGWPDAEGNTTPGGGPRGEFGTADEMFRTIKERWNSLVRPEDRVYVLGDIALKDSALPLLDELNGQKRAVLGNHDLAKPHLYARHFKRVYGAKVLEGGFILTHIPIHPNSLDRKSMQVNVHGHLHEAVVTDIVTRERYEYLTPDPRYVCVSCEQVDYTPISFDEIRARVTALDVWSPTERQPLRAGTTYEKSLDHAAPTNPENQSLIPGASA